MPAHQDVDNWDELLNRVSENDAEATNELMTLLYDDVYKMAEQKMRPDRERKEHTITPTGLVNESYMRLFNGSKSHFRGKERSFIFGAFALAMKRFLIDYARAHNASKRTRPDERFRIHFDEAISMDDPNNVLELNRLLCEYKKFDSLGEKIVTYRFYAGMTLDQIAEITNLTRHKVNRLLHKAIVWFKAQSQLEDEI